MPIEFRVRAEDLKRAVKEIQANRGEFKDSDFADITVSACAVDLAAVGTETTLVADGKRTGNARVPLRLMSRIVDTARSYHARECTILVENGFVGIGRTKVSHPDIVVGLSASHSVSIPVDASALDTLAVATLMDPEKIADAGLREVLVAQKRATAAVQAATDALREFGITAGDITEILDRRVGEAAMVIRRATQP